MSIRHWLAIGGLLLCSELSAAVRHIKVETIPCGTPKSMSPIGFTKIADSWRAQHVGLDVEKPLDLRSVDKAKAVLVRLYAQQGHAVKVESTISQIATGGVEVLFRVQETCTH